MIPKFDRLNSPYGKANTIEELCKQVGLPVEGHEIVHEYSDARGREARQNGRAALALQAHRSRGSVLRGSLQGVMDGHLRRPLINVKGESSRWTAVRSRALRGGNAAGGIFFHNYAGGASWAPRLFGRIVGNELAARAKRARSNPFETWRHTKMIKNILAAAALTLAMVSAASATPALADRHAAKGARVRELPQDRSDAGRGREEGRLQGLPQL